ncbi:MAG: hypothetical protein ACOY30_07005 [Bacillota bacterium]
MAWVMDSCEIEITRDSEQGFYQVEDLCINEVNDVVFYGRIKDGSDNGLEGALLKIFAVKNDGMEVPLNHFYSGKNGYYLVNIPRPDFAVAKYIIRTSKSSIPTPGSQVQSRFQKVSARVSLPLEVNNPVEMIGE